MTDQRFPKRLRLLSRIDFRAVYNDHATVGDAMIRLLGRLSGSTDSRIGLSVSVLRRGNEWHPGVTDPQHVAFATDDLLAVARAAAAAGAPLLAIPGNYYDDLDARLAPPSALLSELRELGILYDRTPEGELLHFYTEVLGGRVFLEFVQRIGGYDGYGAPNAPVRMAAHRRARLAMPSLG